jgi:diguanylate cyclase (GGDEF)-like protein
VLIGDVDHFKRVNDGYGHPIGDQLLVAVAQTLEGTVRGGDLVARYGGEEFVILIEATSLDGARAAAERVRRAVSEIALPTQRGVLHVTMSFGGCLGLPTGDLDQFSTRLMAEADRCLYEAKTGGRNRVVVTPLPTVSAPSLSSPTGGRSFRRQLQGQG